MHRRGRLFVERQIFRVVALGSILAFSSALQANAQKLPFQSYVVRNGLPSNHITSLFQDSRGFLWIGTDNGASMYDGIEFRNFTNQFVTTIIGQRNSPGAVWIGTIAGGILSVESDTIVAIRTGGSVKTLYQDPTGTLWYATDDHVCTISNGITAVVEGAPAGVSDIQGLDDSTVIFLRQDRLFFYRPDTRTVLHHELHLGKGEIASGMVADSTGGFLLVTSHGRIGHITSKGISYRNLRKSLAFSESLPAGILDDGTGILWIATAREILRVNRSTLAFTSTPEPGGPSSICSGAILLDRERNIWIGTASDGLLKLTDQRIYQIDLGQVNNGSYNHVADSDTNGHIWVSTDDGLWELFRTNSGEWKTHQHSSTPRDQGILVDPMNRLWEADAKHNRYHFYEIHAQHNGPSLLQRRGTISFESIRNISLGMTFTIDPKNHAWFAVNPIGIIEFDLKGAVLARQFDLKNGLINDTPRSIFVDNNGNVWSGTWTTGLNVMPWGADSFATVSDYPGLQGAGVRSLLEDRYGALWIGTRYNGLVRRKNNSFTSVSVQDGLKSNAIWCMAETDSRIWCGTDVGMQAVDKSTGVVIPVKNELIGQRVFACGAYRNEFVWAVIARGVIIFHEPEVRSPGIPPPVYIKSLSVNGRPVTRGTAHEFTHDENSISISYVGLSFKDERAVRYQYRINGIDSAWTAPSFQQSIALASLSPGSYSFQVRAINAEGIASSTPASLDFVIIPPVWQRWWFIALMTGTCALLLFMLYKYRVARLLEMERLRTRIAADLHDDVGTNLSSIILATQIIERELPAASKQRKYLEELRSRAGITQDMLKDIVWLLNPRNDTIDDFVIKMKDIVRAQLQDIPHSFTTTVEDPDSGLSFEFKRNVVLFLKEAVTNIAKHSEATNAEIQLSLSHELLTLDIRDNGKGFLADQTGKGNGLANLRARARHMGGTANITSENGKGTKIILTSKIPYSRSAIRRKKSVS